MVTYFDNVDFTELRHRGRQLCDELQKSGDVLRYDYICVGLPPSGAQAREQAPDIDLLYQQIALIGLDQARRQGRLAGTQRRFGHVGGVELLHEDPAERSWLKPW